MMKAALAHVHQLKAPKSPFKPFKFSRGFSISQLVRR